MADPIRSLVFFIIILALAATTFAGVYYFVVEVPAQQNIAGHPPVNAHYTNCIKCKFNCNYSPNPFECLDSCDLIC